MVTVKDIARTLEQWAPPGSAQSYDNVGLLIGNPDQTVERALIALDVTPRVVQEAIEQRTDLLVSHHPLIFKPLKRLTTTDLVSGLALQLAQQGIAYYAIHTNLDAAPGGVSFALAEQLGLTKVRFLEPLPDSLYKLVTFVPASHFDQVREALAGAGAGQIGEYEACAFATEGTGFFRGSERTSPFIGKPGQLEKAQEYRLEVEVMRWLLPQVLQALFEAHPYEEVAYDVYPLVNPTTRVGMGAIGTLEAPEPLSTFLERLCRRLETPAVRFAGNPDQSVQRIAVCGGAGASLIGAAQRAGADAYVTADITYHRFFETMNLEGVPEMAIIDAGHYETERVTEALLQTHLQEVFPSVTWQRTRHRTSPMQVFVSST